MSESPDNTARIRILLTSLVLIIIFILAMVVILAAYPRVFALPPTVTPTITLIPSITPTASTTPSQTPSPSPTRTRRATFTPTITQTPTRTPLANASPTPTGPPTLIPEQPYRGEDIYELVPWSPENADYMAAMMENYPNTLSGEARGENDENFFAAFSYAVFAYKEALLRYPNAPQSENWSWALAYNLARIGDSGAGDAYADLISQGLNQGETEISDLEEWFSAKEPRLELEITEVSPPTGYLSAHLVKLGGSGTSYVLLLETFAAYESVALTSDFDFVYAPDSEAFASDLTGDGVDEIVIYPLDPPANQVITTPQVFSLDTTSILEQPFNPINDTFLVGLDFENFWSATSNPAGGNVLQFDTSVFPPCRVLLNRTYTWGNEMFDLSGATFEVEPNPGTLSFCRFMADHAASAWGARAAIQVMEPILPLWPPAEDEKGEPFPVDEHDEWRYRLGVYHALIGDYEEAVDYFQAIIADPIAPDSRWIEPAGAFLSIYQEPDDVYIACLGAEFCDPRQALTYIVENQPRQNYPEILAYLWEKGVSQRASGYFDFDGDDITEIWITIRHRAGEKLEFWVLMPYPEGVEAIFVDIVESSKPTINVLDDEQYPSVILLDGGTPFSILRAPSTLQPYINFPQLPQFYPNRYKEGLEAASEELFAGMDPGIVQKMLLDLEEYPGLLCKPFWSCDPYFYLLGLTSELADDEDTAITSYLYLWLNYSRSPFTTMARLKLKATGIPPTATPSLTPTASSTSALSTLVPSATLTPTGSATPPFGTPTAVGTSTATQPAYPPPSSATPNTPYP
jgi:hypothetical protein